MVWCSSTSKSPCTESSKSIPPCRANWSNIWSKKAIPVSILLCPLPSRFRVMRMSVSFVVRFWVTMRCFSFKKVKISFQEVVLSAIVGLKSSEASSAPSASSFARNRPLELKFFANSISVRRSPMT